jgi:hypothetical protein
MIPPRPRCPEYREANAPLRQVLSLFSRVDEGRIGDLDLNHAGPGAPAYRARTVPPNPR